MKLRDKEVFLFDLDDTLINTKEATQIGIKRAYMKLASEAQNFDKFPSFEEFYESLEKIYSESKDGKGNRKYYDYDAEVFEDYCLLPQIQKLKFHHKDHSLAARLFYQFRGAKNNSLMALPGAFEVLDAVTSLGAALYCVTQGRCNYQHTKTMLCGMEDKFESVFVTPDKKMQLPGFIKQQGFEPSVCVIVGDSENDIQSGKNSGIDTVCIKSGRRDYKNFKLSADLTFPNLNDFLLSFKNP